MTDWMTAPVPRSSFVENVLNVEKPSGSDFRQLRQTTNSEPSAPGLPVHDDPASWREAFEERAAIREFNGLYPRHKAEVLAFGEVVNQWHLQHAEIIQGECVGCRKRVSQGDDTMTLTDGAEVHFGCVRAYGLRWRKRASDALKTAGIDIPDGWSV